MYPFRLQSVLEYRINVEEKIQGEFSTVRRYLEEQIDILKELVSEREILMNDLRHLQQVPMRADDITNRLAFVENIQKKETEQKMIVEKAREQVEAKRTELVEAVKNRKVMENLKDKDIEEYQKNMRDLEQKNSDEMSVLKFGRRET
jgi:flagellar FliJ protein